MEETKRTEVARAGSPDDVFDFDFDFDPNGSLETRLMEHAPDATPVDSGESRRKRGGGVLEDHHGKEMGQTTYLVHGTDMELRRAVDGRVKKEAQDQKRHPWPGESLEKSFADAPRVRVLGDSGARVRKRKKVCRHIVVLEDQNPKEDKKSGNLVDRMGGIDMHAKDQHQERRSSPGCNCGWRMAWVSRGAGPIRPGCGARGLSAASLSSKGIWDPNSERWAGDTDVLEEETGHLVRRTGSIDGRAKGQQEHQEHPCPGHHAGGRMARVSRGIGRGHSGGAARGQRAVLLSSNSERQGRNIDVLADPEPKKERAEETDHLVRGAETVDENAQGQHQKKYPCLGRQRLAWGTSRVVRGGRRGPHVVVLSLHGKRARNSGCPYGASSSALAMGRASAGRALRLRRPASLQPAVEFRNPSS